MQRLFTIDNFGLYIILAGIVFGLAICFAPFLRAWFDNSNKRKAKKQKDSNSEKPKNRYKTF